MALREIRIEGDPILEKTSRPVGILTPRLKMLIVDMIETMRNAYGVGLAAPQVGVLRRIAIVNVDGENDYVFINPEIIESEGEQTGTEGCLSVPGKVGTVTRPEKVKVRALDIHMKEFELEAEGLLARACCHEFDHLNGILYVSKVEGELRDARYEEDEDEEWDEEFDEESGEDAETEEAQDVKKAEGQDAESAEEKKAESAEEKDAGSAEEKDAESADTKDAETA